VKKILAIICSAVCIALFSIPGNAAQWSFSGPESSGHASADEEASGAFATILAMPSSDDLEVFSCSNFAPFIPMQLDRFVISLLNASNSGDTDALPRLQLNTGIKTENNMTDSRVRLGDTLFKKCQPDDFALKTAVFFIGLGLDFDSGYLQGNAFIGHPLESISTNKFDVSNEAERNQQLDTNAYGFEASAGYQLNNSLTLSGGIGRMTDKNKETDKTEEVYAVYAQAILAVAPGIQVKPEVGQVERVKDKNEPEEIDESFYAGAVWEIKF